MVKTVSDIGEFGLIERIKDMIQREGSAHERVTLGLGDDCAAIRPREGYDLLVTCDTAIEGRHFLSESIRPVDLGRRAMSMNISDIGSMGGRPLFALISLGLGGDTSIAHVEAMYRGFLAELNPFKAAVIGGNITKFSGKMMIDITLMGEAEKDKMVRRSTAKAGDIILVTGYPGHSAAGRKLLMQSSSPEHLKDHFLVKAYNRPSHRAWEGSAVANRGLVNAMIDISDGLLGDLGHLCKASGVGAEIFQDRLPMSAALKKAAAELGEDPYDLILQESDDYELIITCPSQHLDTLRHVVGEWSDVLVSEVGRITERSDGFRLIDLDGEKRSVAPEGWDHFSIT